MAFLLNYRHPLSTPWQINRSLWARDFSPIPAKLVSQIRSGKFVNLSELVAANLVSSETKPQLMLDGHLVLSASPRRLIEDITTWMEAFTVFSLVLTSFFPHRWKDLTLYKLLILRIYRQFSGRFGLLTTKLFVNTPRRPGWPIGRP